MGVLKPHYFFRITKEAREDLHGRPARKTCTEAREDLHMWTDFLASFNGRTIFMAEQSICTEVFHQ